MAMQELAGWPILENLDGQHVMVEDSNFDLDTMLMNRVLQQDLDLPGDDLFDDLSPLTSPEPSRPSSPLLKGCSPLTSAESSCPGSPIGTPAPLESQPAPSTAVSSRPSSPSIQGRSSATSAESSRPISPIERPAPQTAVVPPTAGSSLATPFEGLVQIQDEPAGVLLTAVSKRLARKRAKKTQYRQRKRLKDTADHFGNLPARDDATEKYVGTASPVFTRTDVPSKRVASTGYVALNRVSPDIRIYTLNELVGGKSKWKFNLIHWDGRSSIPIVDKRGRIIGLLAGQPNDPSWAHVQRDAASALETAHSRSSVSSKAANHRRGHFKTLRNGYSHGGGQTHPQNLSNNRTNAQTLNELGNNSSLQRIAGFGSSVFQSWAPNLHAYYVEKLSLLEHGSDLQRPFARSVFPSSTYNLGPTTTCLPHLDFGNLPFGWCAITALGDFDPSHGGHLVLWDCGLVIEFPPGATVLIPSAVVVHSNTPVAKAEKRFSYTQYAAGGLFRWVDHGFQTVDEYRATLDDAALHQLDLKNARRWKDGLALLPHLSWASPPE